MQHHPKIEVQASEMDSDPLLDKEMSFSER